MNKKDKKLLVEVRERLAEAIDIIDQLDTDDSVNESLNNLEECIDSALQLMADVEGEDE